MGSASDEDTRRRSPGNPSMNAALWTPDVYGLISMVLRASTLVPVMSSRWRRRRERWPLSSVLNENW